MNDDSLRCREALDRLTPLLTDLRYIEDAMAYLDTVDTRVTPPDATEGPDGVLTCFTYRLGTTCTVERPVVVYDDFGFQERTAPVLAGLADDASRWARAEVDHLTTAARPVLSLAPADASAVREALLAERQALALGVDTDLADLRVRLAPWRGQAKDSYLLDFQGPLDDAHRTHTAGLMLGAKAVTAIHLAAGGAQRTLRNTLEAGVALVGALLEAWRAAQAPPTEKVQEFLAMAAQGADLLALVAIPKPEVSRAARLTGQGLRWLERSMQTPAEADLPPGVTARHGRLQGAGAEQTAAGLADGVTDVIATLDAVLEEVGAATRGHEDLVARVPLAPREPETPGPGSFDHNGRGAA